MARSLRSTYFFWAKALQRLFHLTLIVATLGFLVLFGLQFPHPSKLDHLWPVALLRQLGNPVIAMCASWLKLRWPSSSWSLLPIGVALVMWIIKFPVDRIFYWSYRRAAKIFSIPLMGEERSNTTDLSTSALLAAAVESEKVRAKLLERQQEIESRLKALKRRHCVFLSVDIVGSTKMKVGESETAIAETFRAYEEMAKQILVRYQAWKEAWTPDGLLICFREREQAVGAAQTFLRELIKFNQSQNRLRTPFRVRCGLNGGDVPIFEDSNLKRVSDPVIDVAAHMQKYARPDTLWLSAVVYGLLEDKSGFRATNKDVDGLKVYEWAVISDRLSIPTKAN